MYVGLFTELASYNNNYYSIAKVNIHNKDHNARNINILYPCTYAGKGSAWFMLSIYKFHNKCNYILLYLLCLESEMDLPCIANSYFELARRYSHMWCNV